MTLMNTKYRKSKDDCSVDSDPEFSKSKPQKRRRYPKRISFDAQPVLDNFANASLGHIALTSIELSQMSAIDESGFYKCISRASLN